MQQRMWGLLTILVLSAGCHRAQPVVVDSPAPTTETPAVDTAAPGAGIDKAASTAGTTTQAIDNQLSAADTATDQPTIKIANWEETQQLVARHPGKVVILDLWASW